MTPPWEGEGVPKLMTKSDDGRRGCLQKVTPLHKRKLLIIPVYMVLRKVHAQQHYWWQGASAAPHPLLRGQ